jgi:hypothetical protein
MSLIRTHPNKPMISFSLINPHYKVALVSFSLVQFASLSNFFFCFGSFLLTGFSAFGFKQQFKPPENFSLP